MARGSVFLIGGGWNKAAFPDTYGRFAAASRGNGDSRIACVLLESEERDGSFARFAAAFAAVGVADLTPLFGAPERPLRGADLDGAAGVLVGGGPTLAYRDAVVATAAPRLSGLLDRGAPYAGFSAGAMIAPDRGIIGGWRPRRGVDLAVCPEDVAEDVEELDVRPGLGLVPFAVDDHASQYGTPTRLLHDARSDLVPEGWAIAEDTAVEAADGRVAVYGLGSAYRVRPAGGALAMQILGNGEHRDAG